MYTIITCMINLARQQYMYLYTCNVHMRMFTCGSECLVSSDKSARYSLSIYLVLMNFSFSSLQQYINTYSQHVHGREGAIHHHLDAECIGLVLDNLASNILRDASLPIDVITAVSSGLKSEGINTSHTICTVHVHTFVCK